MKMLYILRVKRADKDGSHRKSSSMSWSVVIIKIRLHSYTYIRTTDSMWRKLLRICDGSNCRVVYVSLSLQSYFKGYRT